MIKLLSFYLTFFSKLCLNSLTSAKTNKPTHDCGWFDLTLAKNLQKYWAKSLKVRSVFLSDLGYLGSFLPFIFHSQVNKINVV